MTDDDAGVDCLYWQKHDGTKGKPLPQKVMDKIEKEDYWECNVIDQVTDHLCYQQYLREQTEKRRSRLSVQVRNMAA